MDKSQQEEKLNFDEILKDIESTEVTPEILSSYKTHNDFMGLVVELAKEAGSLIAIVASIVPSNSVGWDRDQAVIVGNVVRLAKLISGQIDQVCKKRQETSFIFSRLIFETIVNTKFFIKNASPELFDTYVSYSMRHEKELQSLILEEIKKRGDTSRPIEKRMLESIEALASQSKVSMENMSADEPKNWGAKNFYERAKNVGLDKVYLALYSNGSHGVHGNWMDLLGHHLEYKEGYFLPKTDWSMPSPQILFSTILLLLELLREYVLYIGFPPEHELIIRIDILFSKTRMADDAHEKLLAS